MSDYYVLLNEKIPEVLPDFWQPRITQYVATAKLEFDYSRKELNKTLGWIVNDWVMELENENWNYDVEHGGKMAIIRALNKIAERAWDYAQTFIERDFGYDEGYMGGHPTTPGEKLAQSFLEVFQKSDDKFFGQMGDYRRTEFVKSEAIAKRLIYDIQKWIQIEITRRGG